MGRERLAPGDIRLVAAVVATTPVARAEQEKVQELARALVMSGFFELPGEMARFQGAIDLFQKMVVCGGEGGATCNDGFVCDAGQCIERADVTCANVRCGHHLPPAGGRLRGRAVLPAARVRLTGRGVCLHP